MLTEIAESIKSRNFERAFELHAQVMEKDISNNPIEMVAFWVAFSQRIQKLVGNNELFYEYEDWAGDRELQQ